MSSGMDFFTLHKNSLLESETRTLPNGNQLCFGLYKLPHSAVIHDEFNTRFGPDSPLSPEEHLELVLREDFGRSENLEKSLRTLPFTEPVIGFANAGDTVAKVIHGNRRWLLSGRAGLETIYAWIVQAPSPEDIEFIRDWPEIFQSKVDHSPFHKNKNVYLTLKSARTDDDRETKIERLKKRGLTRPQIEKGERTYKRLLNFCKNASENPEDRATQWKAFETYDQACESSFENLRRCGEFGKVAILDSVANAFLKKKIAHDDLKITLDAFSKLPSTDPIFFFFFKKEIDLDDVTELRRLTIEARSMRDSRKPSAAVEEFHLKIYSRFSADPDPAEISLTLSKIQAAADRLRALLGGLNGGEA